MSMIFLKRQRGIQEVATALADSSGKSAYLTWGNAQQKNLTP